MEWQSVAGAFELKAHSSNLYCSMTFIMFGTVWELADNAARQYCYVGAIQSIKIVKLNCTKKHRFLVLIHKVQGLLRFENIIAFEVS